MSTKSVRYFQLTPEILLEYDYATYIDSVDQEGQSENVYDLYEGGEILASVIENKYNKSNNFLYSDPAGIYKPGFVLPGNMSESKFVQCVNSSGACIWNQLSGNITKTDISGVATENTSDILFDRFRLHFTSRNYMGDYDGIIIRATIYDKSKNKIALLSHYIRKTDDVEINANPMLMNQKLYTTYLDFEIPSAFGLLDSDVYDILPGETVVKNALSSNIMDNTPIVFSIYGVKSTTEVSNFELYNVEKLNTSYVPSQDDTNNIEIIIEESDNGDYFEIYPKVDSGEISFSDYLSKISNDRPEAYIVFHEISLTENYADRLNNTLSKITHREQYIVNAAIDEDDSLEINEDQLEEHMIYRPIAMYSATEVSFTITDTMRILNTLDNTTIVKSGSLTYSNPKKYGKKLNSILPDSSTLSVVNVYNKKNDIDTDSIKITNGGSNVTIENHQHSITSFIESINIGVSIEQISTEEL